MVWTLAEPDRRHFEELGAAVSSPGFFPGEPGLPPASDRMLTTCFLAAGVPCHRHSGRDLQLREPRCGRPRWAGARGVLVNEQAPRAAANPHARYVAQRNQAGAGNARVWAYPDTQILGRAAGSAGNARRRRHGGPAGRGRLGNPALVATSAPSLKILYFAPPLTAEVASTMPELLENRPDFGMTPSDEAIDLRLRGEAKNQLWWRPIPGNRTWPCYPRRLAA